MAFVSLMAAIMCVIAPMSLPIGAVPISLATFVVFITGAVLGPKKGALVVIIYIILGAAGLPVFAGFSGGVQRIVSPTGGFVVSYIPCVVAVSYFSGKFGNRLIGHIMAMIVGAMVCYITGTLWFALFTHAAVLDALFMCVLPFLAGDAIKIVLAAAVSCRLQPVVKAFCRIK